MKTINSITPTSTLLAHSASKRRAATLKGENIPNTVLNQIDINPSEPNVQLKHKNNKVFNDCKKINKETYLPNRTNDNCKHNNEIANS